MDDQRHAQEGTPVLPSYLHEPEDLRCLLQWATSLTCQMQPLK